MIKFCKHCHKRLEVPSFVKGANIKGEVNVTCKCGHVNSIIKGEKK